MLSVAIVFALLEPTVSNFLEPPLSKEDQEHVMTSMAIEDLQTKLGYLSPRPLRPDSGTSELLVDVVIGRERLLFAVDTGAQHSVIDSSVAKKLKLSITPGARDAVAHSIGGATRYDTTVVRDGYVFASPLPPMQWMVVDMSATRKVQKELGEPEMAGYIGMDWLHHFSVIVSVREKTLNLRDPVYVQKAVQGEWLAAAVTPGDPAKAKPSDLTAFTMVKHDATFTIGGKVRKFKFAMDDLRPLKVLAFVEDPAPDDFRLCRYKLDGDTLTIAGPLLPGDDLKAYPVSLDPPKKGEPAYTVAKFTRVAKPKPAAK